VSIVLSGDNSTVR